MMQTFLVYGSFRASARCLDNKRLGKQRLEAFQILRALLREAKGWRNHPAVHMWVGRELSLCSYGMAVCREWKRRGFKDIMFDKFQDYFNRLYGNPLYSLRMPDWIGDPDFHASHRSNLLRKDPKWYGQFGWTESPDLPYVWPVSKGRLDQ